MQVLKMYCRKQNQIILICGCARITHGISASSVISWLPDAGHCAAAEAP